ncbi:MAG TPA: hypothetical protein VLE91_01080 [Candidatus Saccharimonadales bacterium]|nr:hypothetical protein [Candidatus Saccharimonadales bacterium]
MNEGKPLTIEQANSALTQTAVDVKSLSGITDPFERAQKAVEIGLHRRELQGTLLEAQLVKGRESSARTTQEMLPPKENVQRALNLFLQDPQVDMEVIQAQLGKMGNGKPYLPQNAYFALKGAVGTMAYRIREKQNPTPQELETWGEIERVTGKTGTRFPNQEIQQRLSAWFKGRGEVPKGTKDEVSKLEDAPVIRFDKDQSRVFAGLLLAKDNTEIISNGETVTRFSLPPEIKELCKQLIMVDTGYKNIEELRASLDANRKIVISELRKILEGGRLDEIDSQDSSVAQIMTWLYVDQISSFPGDFFQFLEEETQLDKKYDWTRTNVLDSRRIWVLPPTNGKTTTPESQPIAGMSTLSLEEVITHPLFTDPAYQSPPKPVEKGEKPELTIDYKWVKYHPLMKQHMEGVPARTRELEQAFLDDEGSARILEAVRNFDSRDHAQVREFTQTLAGVVFEQLAYEHIRREHAPDGLIVLSPLEVSKLFIAMNPGRQNFDSNFGMTLGIEVPTPDGLILKVEESTIDVINVLEYKLWQSTIPNIESFKRQLISFSPDLLGATFENANKTNVSVVSKALQEQKPEIPAKRINLKRGYDISYFLHGNSEVDLRDYGLVVDYIPIHSVDLNNFLRILTKVIKTGEPTEELITHSLEELAIEEDQASKAPAQQDQSELPEPASAPAAQVENAISSGVGEDVAETQTDEQDQDEELASFTASAFAQDLPNTHQEKGQSMPKSQLERKDPKIAENLRDITAEAMSAVRIDGSPLSGIKGSMYDFLKDCIDRRLIKPERRDGDKVFITRTEYTLAKYLRSVLRNQALTGKLLGDLEGMIKTEVEKQEMEKAAQGQPVK